MFPLNSANSANLTFFVKKIIAGSLEAAYSLNWGAQKIWG